MRRIISIALAVLMLASVCTVGVFTVSAENNVVTSAPATGATAVNTAADFAAMKADGNYYLAADITLNATYKTFKGTLDGQGHTVTVSAPMFESLDGATVKNLTVAGSVSSGAATPLGAVASTGKNVTVIGVTNNATVTTSNTSARVGGLIGFVTEDAEGVTLFEDCVNNGAVTAGDQGGGIAGFVQTNDTAFVNCVNNAKIVSLGNYAGGIVGRTGTDEYRNLSATEFRNCINNGEVVSMRQFVGGMIGHSRSAVNFYGCVNNGNVGASAEIKDDQAMCAGGMFGKITAPVLVDHCVNTGKVSGVRANAGGMGGNVGAAQTSGMEMFLYCFSSGDVVVTGSASAGSGTNAGGIIGYCFGSDGYNHYPVVMYCGVTGNVTNAAAAANGFVGYVNSAKTTIKYNYFLGELKNTTSSNNFSYAYGIYWNNKSVSNNISDNYFSENATFDLYAQNSVETSLDKYSWIVTPDDVTDGVLLEKLNTAIGYDAFVQPDGAKVPTPETYADLVAEGETFTKDVQMIYTEEDFLSMHPFGNYRLNNDLVLTKSYDRPFHGTIDCDGQTLTISAPIFTIAGGATIKNLHIAGKAEGVSTLSASILDYTGALASIGYDMTVESVTNNASVKGALATGGIVGYLVGGTFKDCYNAGAIQSITNVGGIVGCADGASVYFYDCSNGNNGGMSATDGENAGGGAGILGAAYYTETTFVRCSNTAPISLYAIGNRTGGIAGYIYSVDADRKNTYSTATFIDCVNAGNVFAYDQCGGIVGWAECKAVLEGCVNKGQVRSGQNYAGGIAGRVGADKDLATTVHTFTNCVNEVSAKIMCHRQYSAGILGFTAGSATFDRCVNHGEITGDDPFFGASCTDYGEYLGNASKMDDDPSNDHGTFSDCHRQGASNTRPYDAGGIAGRVNFEVKARNCINTGSVTGNRMVGGIVGACGNGGGSTLAQEFTSCINTGDVMSTGAGNTSSSNCTGGIFGYARSDAGTKPVTAMNCGVSGTVVGGVLSTVAGRGVGGIGGYANNGNCYFRNNYIVAVVAEAQVEPVRKNTSESHVDYNTFYGSTPGTAGGYAYLSALVWVKDRMLTMGNYNGNYLLAGTGLPLYRGNAGYEMVGADYQWTVTAEDVASGKLCFLLNKNAGEDVFFQQIGVDAVPMVDMGGDKYFVRYDAKTGTYYNEAEYTEPVAPETTTEAETTTEEVVETTAEVVETTAEVVETTAEVVETTAEVVETTAEVVETTAEVVETTAEVVETTAEPETDPETQAPETEPETQAPDTEPTPDPKGCGSVIGASVALVALALIAPAGIVLKKKD